MIKYIFYKLCIRYNNLHKNLKKKYIYILKNII